MTRRLASVVAFGLSVVAWPAAQASKAVETFDAAWTIVRDSHFDPTFNGVDWQAVRTELRPRATDARTDGELRAIIRDMLGRLGQSHFALLPSGADRSGGPVGDLSGHPGFDLRVIGNDLVVNRVDPQGGAAAGGVRPGWKLTSIEAQLVSEVLKTVPEGLPDRLRQLEVFRAIEVRVRGAQGTRVPLIFEDGAGNATARDIERRREAGQPVTVGNLPTMSVRVETDEHRTPRGASAGVIRFNIWMPAVDPLVQQAVDRFRSHAGIIVDLRGNPGGLAAMVMGISGHFLAERKSLGVMKTRETELRFHANPRLVSAAGERVEPFKGPVAILVDGMTGSASECFAGGMQSLGRARVFGQTTMGQALPALFDKLPNGDVLIHAYGDFLTADGTRLEARGVIPDEVVPLRRDELLAGRDATLEAALAWIDGGGSREPVRKPDPIALAGLPLLDSSKLRPAAFSRPPHRGHHRGI